MARPMPRLAPVTIATRPFISIMCLPDPFPAEFSEHTILDGPEAIPGHRPEDAAPKGNSLNGLICPRLLDPCRKGEVLIR